MDWITRTRKESDERKKARKEAKDIALSDMIFMTPWLCFGAAIAGVASAAMGWA